MATSFNDDDPTLPVEFDGSMNPDLLPEVTFGPHLENSDGTIALVAKAGGSGRMSPIRARTMKDYEERLSELRKENFSLKLRIYYLEEKMQQTLSVGGEDLYKMFSEENVELKVEVDTLKKDLQAKQELLKKASEALQTISSQHETELEQARSQCNDTQHHISEAKVTELQLQVESYKLDLAHSNKQLNDAGMELQELVTKNDELLDANRKLEATRRQLMEKLETSSDSDETRSIQAVTNEQVQEKQKSIDELRSVLKTKELIIEQQEAELKESAEKYKTRVTELEKHVSEYQQSGTDLSLTKKQREEINEKKMSILNLQSIIAAKENEEEKLQARVTGLQEELSKVKEALSKAENGQESKQNLLHDAYRQIDAHEKMIQSLVRNIKDKDQQLETYINNITDNKQSPDLNESIVESLTEQLRSKEQEIQDLMRSHRVSIEEKNEELSQQKALLRDREQDIERANQMLLNTEDTINTLEAECKEKDDTMQQLAQSLKTLQQQMKDLSDRHNAAVEEKESLIAQLTSSLQANQERLEASTDDKSEELMKQLQQKEQLIQELLLARNKSAHSVESVTKQYEDKLSWAMDEIKSIQEKSNVQISDLHRQIQSLLSDLNKKDYEIQSLENRSTFAEEQQQELIDKLRDSISEKDNTIQALLESGTEKERLFRSVHDKSPDAETVITASKLLELQDAKQQIARLKNDIVNKDALIDRLRVAAERRSPRPDSRMSVEQLTAPPPPHPSTPPPPPPTRASSNEDHLQALSQSQAMNEQFKRQISSMKRKLEAFGAGSTEDFDEVYRLREEVASLKEQLRRPPTPTRFINPIGGGTNAQLLMQAAREQLNESQQMKQSLKVEQDIYRQLIHVHKQSGTGTPRSTLSDKTETVELQLARIHELRQMLEEGLRRNEQLRDALEKQQDEGDGGRHSEKRLVDSCQQTDAAVTGLPPPPSLPTARPPTPSRSPGPPTLPKPRVSVDNSMSNSYLPTYHSLPGQEQDEPTLASADIQQLQDMVRSLRIELKEARCVNTALAESSAPQLNSSLNNTKVTELKNKLQDSEVVRRQAESQLDNLLQTCDAGDENRMIRILKQRLSGLKEQLEQRDHQLKDMQAKLDQQNSSNTTGIREIHNEVRRLRSELSQAENVNAILRKQLDMDSQASGFNPNLLVQMAQEIEDLKNKLAELSNKQTVGSLSSLPFASQPGGVTVSSSHIGSSTVGNVSASAVSRVNTAIQQQLQLTQARLTQAQSKLESTESTVRSQTEKMKYYRSLLEMAGLLNANPKRAHSESNLQSGVGSAISQSRASSTDNISLNLAGLSPDLSPSVSNQYMDYGQSDNTAVLKEQIATLRTQLSRYASIIRNLNQRVKHTASDDLKHGATPPPPPPLPPPHPTSALHSDASAVPDAAPVELSSKPPLARSVSDGLGSRLRDEIKGLKQRLEEADEKNRQLQQRLTILNTLQVPNNAANTGASPKPPVFGSPKTAASRITKDDMMNTALSRQLTDCRGLCTGLSKKMDDLTELMDDMFTGDGEDELLDLSGSKVIEFKGTLVDARNVLTYLMMMMDGLENISADSEDLSSTLSRTLERTTERDQQRMDVPPPQQHSTDHPHNHQEEELTELQTMRIKYQEASSRINQLEQQLLMQPSRSIRSTIDHIDSLNDTLDRSFDGANASSEGMKQILKLQREKTELTLRAEHNKAHLEQVQAENARLTTNNTFLEAENLRLKSFLQREKEKAIDMAAEKVRLHDIVEQRDNLNDKLKTTLKDSNNMVEALQAQVDRLTKELNDRSATVHRLESRLRSHRTLGSKDGTDGGGNTGGRGGRYSHGGPDDVERGGTGTSSITRKHAGDGAAVSPNISAHSDVDLLKEASIVSRVDYEDLQLKLRTSEEANHQLKEQVREMRAQQDKIGMDKSLQQHLEDIRQLRLKLEESIAFNDKLRAQLEHKLQQAKHPDASNEEIRELKQKIEKQDSNKRKIHQLQQDMFSIQNELDRQKAHVEDKTKELQDVRTELKTTHEACVKLKKDKATLTTDVNRLKKENTELRSQLEENEGLNKTLNLELAVLSDGKSGTAKHLGGVDLQLVYDEIHELRIQLVNTIENNNRLRKQLELQINGEDDEDKRSRRGHRSGLYNGTSVDNLKKAKSMNGTGSSAFNTGSSADSLYVVGEIDDHEILKKSITEGCIILKTMRSSVNERLRAYANNTQATEYRTFKALSTATDNMKHCLQDLDRLSSSYWVSPIGGGGGGRESQHSLMTTGAGSNKEHAAAAAAAQKQNVSLQKELAILQSKYKRAKQELVSAKEGVKASNKTKEMIEQAVIKRLNETHKVLRDARENMERKIQDS